MAETNEAFPGVSSMHALMRERDWASTPLGPPSGWSPGLRMVVRLVLDAHFPMYVAWGPQLVLIYNDAYAELLGVELTETCMAGEDETVAGELDGLRALGVKLLVDDFGTGYSSLSQLQRLNVDILKVDRAFTLTLAESEEGKALFKAIVSMADALGIGIVAEGVETSEQLRVLQSLRCDEVQGHFVSRPVPPHDMARLMLRRFLFPPAVRELQMA